LCPQARLHEADRVIDSNPRAVKERQALNGMKVYAALVLRVFQIGHCLLEL
jgi:hypothetical protein